jgi:hypothetical protein
LHLRGTGEESKVKGKGPAYVLLLALLVATGSATYAGQAPAPLRDEGEVFVYLEPFPSDADRLGFHFGGRSCL